MEQPTLNQPENTREHGVQPLDAMMQEAGLDNHAMVVASGDDHLTHKMVSKARGGRFLSVRVRMKVLRAFNAATHSERTLKELFNY